MILFVSMADDSAPAAGNDMHAATAGSDSKLSSSPVQNRKKVSSYRRKKRGTVKRKKKAVTPRWEPDFRSPSSRSFAANSDVLRPIRAHDSKFVARGDGLSHKEAVLVMAATLRQRVASYLAPSENVQEETDGQASADHLTSSSHDMNGVTSTPAGFSPTKRRGSSAYADELEKARLLHHALTNAQKKKKKSDRGGQEEDGDDEDEDVGKGKPLYYSGLSWPEITERRQRERRFQEVYPSPKPRSSMNPGLEEAKPLRMWVSVPERPDMRFTLEGQQAEKLAQIEKEIRRHRSGHLHHHHHYDKHGKSTSGTSVPRLPNLGDLRIESDAKNGEDRAIYDDDSVSTASSGSAGEEDYDSGAVTTDLQPAGVATYIDEEAQAYQRLQAARILAARVFKVGRYRTTYRYLLPQFSAYFAQPAVDDALFYKGDLILVLSGATGVWNSAHIVDIDGYDPDDQVDETVYHPHHEQHVEKTRSSDHNSQMAGSLDHKRYGAEHLDSESDEEGLGHNALSRDDMMDPEAQHRILVRYTERDTSSDQNRWIPCGNDATLGKRKLKGNRLRRQLLMDPSVANGFLGVKLGKARAGSLPRVGDRLVIMAVDYHCGELYEGLCMLPIGTCVATRHHAGDKCKVDVEHAVLSKTWTAWYSNAHVQIVPEAWYKLVANHWAEIATPLERSAEMEEGEGIESFMM